MGQHFFFLVGIRTNCHADKETNKQKYKEKKRLIYNLSNLRLSAEDHILDVTTKK